MIAVLTGDIVNSTKMSDKAYAEVIATLKHLLDQAHQKYQAIGEIYRGDEFQIQFPRPAHALECSLLIKLALHLSKATTKPIQCTLSLAYGDHSILADKPNTSSGPVFIDSGRGLTKTQRGDISIKLASANDNEELKLLTDFLNHLLNRLTKSQAELLYQYIESHYAEHKKIAELIGTTRQNISNRLANIGAFLVRDYIEIINHKVTNNLGE
ncbi:hypothetical protein tinsulaeT_03440 [Thalassotalea insulae]|uniref:Transcriptional regulator n=1 Tax=Thalassotalea insulae TaxID=2056778 RepID=A0ABQ6GPC4_9GAMM|nr:hypothetical protein [Thalassotalea insulae]GLX77004.1 hypothetical protein tinsulaeT_03440 [Thalassotalea insulae]